MALNWNAPENWAKWIRGCLKDPDNEIDLAPQALAMVTGQDARALHAIAACWDLALAGDEDGVNAGLAAAAALLDGMQEKCWPIARELLAQQGEWSDRAKIWPRVLARRAARALSWRGSVRDLATDLAALLTPEQLAELHRALVRARRDAITDMAELRGMDSADAVSSYGQVDEFGGDR